ncbi:MAG: AGE family epimerase/isomerase [Clostridia bacterium]|nr:AGE family epimerase/isomerase [Clostridia bacterium]
MNMKEWQEQFRKELQERIIPFWQGLKDETFGGYYGLLDFDLNLDKRAVKGCILNSRILWFFSSAAMCLKDESLLKDAEHAYRFMVEHCVDQELGGVYWSVNYDGTVCDDTKHTYNQAFAIYALAAYARATGKQEPIQLAWKIFDIIESKCRNEGGYLEAYTRDFRPASNEKLSENDVMATRTMNTLLHVFEGYSGLYQATKDARLEARIREMMDIFVSKIYNYDLHRQEVFFDADYNTLIDLHSYGHDIESAWLLDWGCSLLEDKQLNAKVIPIFTEMAQNVYEKAYHGAGLYNECERGVDDKKRIWWVQAETVVGFMNAWQRNPEMKHFLKASQEVWEYIKEKIIDKREGSEWYWAVRDDGTPDNTREIVEPWKCPYHNGRMCIEMIRRLEA